MLGKKCILQIKEVQKTLRTFKLEVIVWVLEVHLVEPKTLRR